MDDFKTVEDPTIKKARETLYDARAKFLDENPDRKQLHRRRCRSCRELFPPNEINENGFCPDCPSDSENLPVKKKYHRRQRVAAQTIVQNDLMKQCFFCDGNLFQIFKNNVIKCVQCGTEFSKIKNQDS